MSPRKSLFVFAFTGVIFFRLASLLCFLQLASPYGYAESKVPDLEEIVRKVQEVYGRHCCFSAAFDQLTVNTAMDLKDRFQGTMYVRKPSAIALEVESPEKQKVVMRGRSYTVYFPQDGSAVSGEIPPEINVEHFFGFFANIGRIDKTFSVQFAAKAMDKDEMLFFLELSDKSNPHIFPIDLEAIGKAITEKKIAIGVIDHHITRDDDQISPADLPCRSAVETEGSRIPGTRDDVSGKSFPVRHIIDLDPLVREKIRRLHELLSAHRHRQQGHAVRRAPGAFARCRNPLLYGIQI